MRLLTWADVEEELSEFHRKKAEAKQLVYLKGSLICVDHKRHDGVIIDCYGIPAGECKDIMGLCRWLFHMEEKQWVTMPMLEEIAACACEYHGLREARKDIRQLLTAYRALEAENERIKEVIKSDCNHNCILFAKKDGTCSEGCCDRLKCMICGKSWLYECED